jgi:hypothetical protein
MGLNKSIMKRAIAILITLIGLGHHASAQTFAEWFNQKKTQKKYLAEQIAALKLYGSYIKKGYDISKKGLGMISDIKDGDFKMHGDYFNKLKSVNPEVSKSPKVTAIITIQKNTRTLADRTQALLQSPSGLTSKETDYIGRVYQRLNSDCLRTISELEQVISPGALQMKDDERIERIEQLYQQSQDQNRFAKSFGNDIAQLLLQKNKQQNEIKDLRTWYGIKND